jgi:hypothetical protein
MDPDGARFSTNLLKPRRSHTFSTFSGHLELLAVPNEIKTIGRAVWRVLTSDQMQNAVNQHHPAFEKCPLSWIEMKDTEALSFEKATWIPLLVQRNDLEHGRRGYTGHRNEYCNFDSIIVPADLQNQFRKTDWHSVSRKNSDHAWANDEGFWPPGNFMQEPKILYPVLQQSFDTGEPIQWHLLQELEIGMNLQRRKDSWIRPEENDIEVAKLERDPSGTPEALLFRAEHLRDYLCAKKSLLLLTGFVVRDAVEESFSGLNWPRDHQQREFGHGEWDGTLAAIHEGGGPFGMETGVLRMWRESVDPNLDLPQMAHPSVETAPKSEAFTTKAKGRKLSFLSGRIWVKHWVHPAERSPRIRRDHVPARVPFMVENQEQKTLSGDGLVEYRGWLWFKPSVIPGILTSPKSSLGWFTEKTGQIGAARDLKVTLV